MNKWLKACRHSIQCLGRTKGFVVLFFLIQGLFPVQSQQSINHWRLEGYLETYFAHDAPARPQRRPAFYSSFTDLDRLAVNLLSWKVAYERKRWAIHGAVMQGSYCRENLASEPALLRHLNEAFVQWRRDDKGTLAVQAGVIPSHIGAETARGLDGYTLTRSLQADNSPYYESGLRIDYRPSGKHWAVAFLVLNGWQRIRVSRSFRVPAVGHAFQFGRGLWRIQSNSFVGPADPEQPHVWRLFHNLIVEWQAKSRWTFLAVADGGISQGSIKAWWVSPTLMVRRQLTESLSCTLRGELFMDPQGVVLRTPSALPGNVKGISFNADWHIWSHLLLRAEARWLHSVRPVFGPQENPSFTTLGITGAIILHFKEDFLASPNQKKSWLFGR
ncbi:MAG: porin [Flavobacteriales bacterium]|nr:porin [Flavobacteriales bacterium]